jgi:VWFA-related protein
MKSFMVYRIFVLIILVVTPLSVDAQTPQTTPPDDEVVRISTQLIQLDVSITDKNGKIVNDVRPEEIEIYENGKKQTVTNLSFVSRSRTEPATKNNSEMSGVPLPTRPIRTEQVRRSFALVIDDLTLSFESAYQTRRTVKKFVDEQMQDGDLVAIIRTGAGIGALQQFTSDKRVLYAAIDRIKWNPLGRGGISAFAPIEPSMLEELKAAGVSEIDEEDLAAEKNFNTSFDDFRSSTFASGTLGALRYIVDGMRELPGRKSVVLFSDGFRLFGRDEMGSTGNSLVADFMRKLIDVANRSSVVFYTIDPRGLQYTGITAADRIVDPTGERLGQLMSERADELFETQAGLHYLARETGGFAVVNNNDISGGLRRVLDDQSYYLIAYEPDSTTFDPSKLRFNKVEIRVLRKDLTVRYRRGFVNVADENISRSPNRSQTPALQIQTALTSPFGVGDISLSLNSLYGNDPGIGNFVRSLVHVDARDLKFEKQQNGKYKAEIAILAVSYGDNGQPVDQSSRGYTIDVDEPHYRKIMENGFVYQYTFPVKKPGAYQYRVAVRDQIAAKVGSASQFIEIPNIKKGRLTLSGIVLERHSIENWKALVGNHPSNTADSTTVLNDSSLKRFKKNGVLQYAFEIYNAKLNAAQSPNIKTKIRLFRDDQLVLDGTVVPYDPTGQPDKQRLRTAGALSLGPNLKAGEYLLQIIVIDDLAKSKQKIVTQAVQFEIVD